MERASRLIVLVSIAVAGVAHAWLAQPHPALAPAAAGAFVITLITARASMSAAVALVAASAYVAPALLSAAFSSNQYSLILVWLAAAAGPVFANAGSGRWYFPEGWKIPLAAWLLIIAVSWPLVAGREIDFSIVVARSHSATNGVAQTSPPLNAAFVTIVALTQMLALAWLDLLWARFRQSGSAAIARTVALPFLLGVGLSSLAGIYQRLVDPEFMNLPLWSNLGRAGGLMNDANSLGVGAALWAPVAIALAWATARIPLGITLYVLLAMGMWSTGSRTALIAFAAGSIGIVVATLQRRGVWRPRYGRIAAATAVIVFVAAAAVVPREFASGNPLKRAFDRVPRLEMNDIRRFLVDDLWVRFGYGQAAVDIIREYPVAGVGVGAFHPIAPDYVYLRTGRAVTQDNAQNWWRHQVAELGVVGSLPALWSSVLVVLLLRNRAPAASEAMTTVLGGSVIGVGLASLLGVPTQHPATALSFATVLFWLQRLSVPDTVPPRAASRRGWWVLTFALATVVAAALASAASQGLHPRARANRTGSQYSHGLSHSEGISDYGDFRWAAREAVLDVPAPRRWLQLTLWAPYANLQDRNVRAHVRVNGREVIAHTFTSADAETFFLAIADREPRAAIELTVTGAVNQHRAIQTAMMWREALPRTAAPERIVR